MTNKIHKIKPLDEILSEGFFNPFDEINKEKDSKPKSIYDGGGLLKARKESFNINRIELTKNSKGNYIITAKSQFAKGEVVEICPIMILGIECKAINKLKDIVFELDKDNKEFAVVFGYGSIYRHSNESNLEYAYNRQTKQMYFLAKRFINVGEELSINYGTNYWQERNTMNLIGKDSSVNTNESEMQPNITDMQNKETSKVLGNPMNQNNPANNGVAITGVGQQ